VNRLCDTLRWLLDRSAVRSAASIALLISILAVAPSCGGPAATDAAQGGHDQVSNGDASPEATEAQEEAIAVRVTQVSRAPLSSLYTTSATLRADKQATVTARTSGVIRELLVEEGHRVQADQPLAILENDEQQIDYDRAATARDTKQREFDRALELHEQGLMSDEEYETVRRESEETKQDAAMAQLKLSRTVIRAPFTGRILTRHLDAGTTVGDGAAVFDIADLDPLYADVNVPERHISRLHPGQAVRLVADASAETADASIERIAPLVDPESGTVKVTLAVDETTSLRPGSFVRVLIVTDTHQQALVVPRSSLVAEGRRWHLFRVDEDGENVERVEVKRGYEEQDRVEILGVVDEVRELNTDDRVVVLGASALTDGVRIEILEDGDDPRDGDDRQATTTGAGGDAA
jgi:membrane fusion protein (multidrug efflux system)